MTRPRIATNGAADEGSIFGRERELTMLGEMVDGVRERGTVLFVRGEAGIGKSTLLAAASKRAEAARMRVLRATGVQSEAQLPFAGLHQLVMPLLGHADRLPAPQQTALLAAFASLHRDAPTTVDFANDDRAPLLFITFEHDHIIPRTSAATMPRSTRGRKR